MSPLQHITAALLTWGIWVLVGILYDPVVAPREKNGARHTAMRFLSMFAYCQTLRLWIWASRQLEPNQRGKTIGELMAAVFAMGSRKYIRRVTCRVLPW